MKNQNLEKIQRAKQYNKMLYSRKQTKILKPSNLKILTNKITKEVLEK